MTRQFLCPNLNSILPSAATIDSLFEPTSGWKLKYYSPNGLYRLLIIVMEKVIVMKTA